MIKTLRITSFVAAVLAAGLFVFFIFFGFRSDAEIEKFLSAPSVVEEFKRAQGSKPKRPESQSPPLVKAAEAFGLYLNPPPPPPAKKEVREQPRGDSPPPPPDIPKSLTPKFKVIATSFYESSPHLSLVLIDEPGKGRHWVRQGSTVNHLTIEQVKDGQVIVKGGKNSFELAVEQRPPEINLLMGSSPVSKGAAATTLSKAAVALESPEAQPRIGAESPVISSQPQIPAEEAKSLAENMFAEMNRNPQMSEEEAKALAEKMFAEMDNMGVSEGGGSNKIDSGRGVGTGTAPTEEELSSGVEAARVTGEEAEKLDNLGQELKDVQDDTTDPEEQRRRRIEMLRERRERAKKARELAQRRKANQTK